MKKIISSSLLALGISASAFADETNKINDTQRVHNVLSEVGWSCTLSETGTDNIFWDYSIVSTLNITKDNILTILYKINFDEKDLSYKAIHHRWDWVYDDIWYTIERKINSNLSAEEEAQVLDKFNPLTELKSMPDDKITQLCLPIS